MFQNIFKEIIHDRTFVVVLLIFAVLSIALAVATAAQISPSDLQLPIRYSSFGVTNFYRDKWYYLISFAAIGIVIFVLHTLIAARLYAQKSRQLAIAFVWLGIGLIITSYFTVFALFKVVSLSQ